MESLAPPHLAESWDNVGFLLGNEDREIHRILVALEATDTVVEEAVEEGIDLIITHHPLFFSPIKSLTFSTPIGRKAQKLIQNNIGVYSAHTNLDIVLGGTNDILAKAIGLKKIKGLFPVSTQPLYKFVVYVPKTHLEKVRIALADAGAGHMENYKNCAFVSSGEGLFTPKEGANPHIGTQNELERVSEMKIEVLVEQTKLLQVENAMKEAHPYEVPAWDTFPLENQKTVNALGRIGYLEEPVTLNTLAKKLAKLLKNNTLKMVGDKDKPIQKIALCTGAGMDLVEQAHKHKCDVFITGDIKYHQAQDALEQGLCLIDAGHFPTEVFYVEFLVKKLLNLCEKKGYDVTIFPSKKEKNPFCSVHI